MIVMLGYDQLSTKFNKRKTNEGFVYKCVRLERFSEFVTKIMIKNIINIFFYTYNKFL